MLVPEVPSWRATRRAPEHRSHHCPELRRLELLKVHPRPRRARLSVVKRRIESYTITSNGVKLLNLCLRVNVQDLLTLNLTSQQEFPLFRIREG